MSVSLSDDVMSEWNVEPTTVSTLGFCFFGGSSDRMCCFSLPATSSTVGRLSNVTKGCATNEWERFVRRSLPLQRLPHDAAESERD